MRLKTLNEKLRFNPWLMVSLFLTVGCSSIKMPDFSGPKDLRFSPIPQDLSLSGDESQSTLGFISPLDVKFNFDWPVDRARLTRGFMPHARPRPHLGLDLAAPKGTPIFAAHSGRIIYAGSGFRGYGRFIILEHENDWATFYGHLDQILIGQGDTIKQGQLIGKMGKTGRATGTHLHFELRRERKAIDPIAFLPGASDWVAK